MKRLFVAGLIGISMAVLGASSANAVEPIDMPPLTCDELIGKAAADEARAAMEEYKARQIPWALENGRPEEADLLTNAQFESLSGPPSSTSCHSIVSQEGGPFISVDADTPESRASFDSWFGDVQSTFGADGQMVIGDLTLVVYPEYPGPVYGIVRNGFIYWSRIPEWIASAVPAVEARMAELNAPPPPSPSETSVPVAAADSDVVTKTAIESPKASTPSVLSKLQTLFDINLNVGRVGAIVGGSLVLSMLLIIPTFLLQRVVRSRYTAIARALEATSNGWGRLWRAGTNALLRLPTWASIGVGLVAASTLVSLVSPSFGFNGQTARVFSSVLVSLIIESVLVLVIMLRWMRRNGAAARVELRMGSLVIVLLTVLLSRLTGFEPGIVFGLVLTLAVLTRNNKVTEAAESIFEAILAIGIGLVAWVGYSAAFVSGWGENVTGLWLQEVLAAVTLGTLTALPIALLPFGDLPGRKIFEHGRIVWVGFYALASTLFLGIVMPFPESVDQVSWPFATWMMFFVGYTVFALAAWGIDQLQQRRSKQLASVD